jgi:hypothetical protein
MFFNGVCTKLDKLDLLKNGNKVRVMVFYATFNNISVISWWRKPEYLKKTTDLSKGIYFYMKYQI